MKVPYFVPCINTDDRKKVLKALSNQWLTNGPFLEEFEFKFRKYVHTNYSIGVGSATQALHLSLREELEVLAQS